jgi:hypothetical protein
VVEIVITNVTTATEHGLGPLYRIEQTRDGVPWVHLIARFAVAADMELFGVEDPMTVIDWHLHEPLGPFTIDASAADRLAFEAQANAAEVHFGLRQANVGDPAEDNPAATRDEARDLKIAEVGEIKATATVLDGAGLDQLRTLITGDQANIETDREIYRSSVFP